MLPPLKGCGLPASVNTRWILYRLSIALAQGYSASAPIQLGFTCSRSMQTLVTRLHAYGFAVKSDMARKAFKLFAFIPPINGVGIPAHLAKGMQKNGVQAFLAVFLEASWVFECGSLSFFTLG